MKPPRSRIKSSSRTVRVALLQSACGLAPEANLKNALREIGLAARRGANIVLLQELFRTRYFCQTQDPRYFDWAEAVPGPTVEILGRAAKTHGMVIIAPLFEKAAGGVYYNTAAVLDADGRYLGKYRKMHIPDDPGFYEKFYFVPGDLGFPVFETRFARIGTLICWDQWFPEAARLMALQGAEILFYPTAIGWKKSRPAEAREYHAAWEAVQRGHAIANGVFAAAANRVGLEGEFQFWGGSFVADPFGKILRRAGSRETVLVQDCDLSRVEQTRREWPFFRDRRIDAYGPVSSRFIEKNIR